MGVLIVLTIIVIVFRFVALHLIKYFLSIMSHTDRLFNSNYVFFQLFHLFSYLGNIRQWLSAGWRPAIIRLTDLAIGIAVIRIGLESVLDTDIFLPKFFSESFLNQGRPFFETMLFVIGREWAIILFFWFLLEVLLFAWKSSQRLVIEDTTEPLIKEKTEKEPNPESKGEKNDKTQEGALQSAYNGLEDLLRVRLNLINGLYEAVDEQRAIPSQCGAGKPIDASMSTEDVSSFLESTIGKTSDLSLGPIKIPMGSIASLFGRMLRGPTLRLQLHTETQSTGSAPRYFLTATLTRPNGSKSWQIDPKEFLDEELAESLPGKDRPIEDMVRELAHRVFALLAYDNSKKQIYWKASYRFSRGLRFYREGLLDSKERYYDLKKAEKSLIQALMEANDFDLAYYNLGVVYTELGQMNAANSAFKKAIKINSERSRAYYALGFNLLTQSQRCVDRLKRSECHGDCAGILRPSCGFENKVDSSKRWYSKGEPLIKDQLFMDCDQIIVLCDRSIGIDEGDSPLERDYSQIAKALDLRAHARYRLAQLKSDPKSTENAINEAIKDSQLAIRCAWLNLCMSAFRGEDVSEDKNLVSECILDLAYFLTHRSEVDGISDRWKDFQEAESALKSALPVDPHDFNLHFDIGKILYCLSRQTILGLKLDDAEYHLFTSLGLKLDDAEYHLFTSLGLKLDDAEYHLLTSLGLKPDDSKCWSYLALLDGARAEMYDPKEKRSSKALLSMVSKVERIPLYGPNADSSALELAAQTCWYLKDKIVDDGKITIKTEVNAGSKNEGDKAAPKNSHNLCGPGYAEFKAMIFRRAAFLAELNRALEEEDENSCHFIGEKFNRCKVQENLPNFPLDRSWRRAQMRIHQLRHRRSKMGKGTPCCPDKDSVSCKREIDFIQDLEVQTKEFLRNRHEEKKENGKIEEVQICIEKFWCLMSLFDKFNDDNWNRIWTILQNLHAIWSLCFEIFMIELGDGSGLSEEKKRKTAVDIDEMANSLCKKYKAKYDELTKDDELTKRTPKNLPNNALTYILSIKQCQKSEVIRTPPKDDELMKKDLMKNNECSNKVKHKGCVNEYVHFLVDVGQLYLSPKIRDKLDSIFPDGSFSEYKKSSKPLSIDKAADFLNRAVEIMGKENPREMRLYPLLALHAKALSKSGKVHDEIDYDNRYKSLKQAKKAQIINPIGRYECQVTGKIYSDLMEYDKAREAFNVVTAFSKDDREDPDILMELGLTQLLSVKHYLEVKERKRLLIDARDYFERAWRVYDRSDVDRRGEARYYIGLTHLEELDYPNAIPHFLIVYNVRGPESKWLFAALQLGRAYLKLGEFYKSEKVFRDAVDECLKTTSLERSRRTLDCLLGYNFLSCYYNWASDLDKCKLLNKKVKIECGEGKALGSILTEGLIGLALSKVERDVDPESVMGIAGMARILAESRLIKGEKVQEDLISKATDCQGRIYYKISLTKENKEARKEALKNAVSMLEKSVYIRPNADNYLHLAQAYHLQLDKGYLGEDGTETLTDKIKACICHTRHLDFSSEYETVLKELEGKLKEKELSQINSCPKMQNE